MYKLQEVKRRNLAGDYNHVKFEGIGLQIR